MSYIRYILVVDFKPLCIFNPATSTVIKMITFFYRLKHTKRTLRMSERIKKHRLVHIKKRKLL